jgi:hypothetical protein
VRGLYTLCDKLANLEPVHSPRERAMYLIRTHD